MKDEILPELTDTQSFNCVNGCGECKAIEFDFVYSETLDATTDEIIQQKTHKAFKSSCCGDEMEIWDEAIDDAFPWPAPK